MRDRKAERGQAVSSADIDRLPEVLVLARPRAVLFELSRRARGNPTLLYVFDPLAGGDRKGKIVVRVRQPTDRGRETNRFVTATYIDIARLREPRYTLLDGSLD